MYQCKIISRWVKGVEVFFVEIKYLGDDYNYGPFDSAVAAGNVATEWYIENVNDDDVAICEAQQ